MSYRVTVCHDVYSPKVREKSRTRASLVSRPGLFLMGETKTGSSSIEQYAEVEDWMEMFRWLRKSAHPGSPVSRIRMEGGLLMVQHDKIVTNFKDGRHMTIYADRKRGAWRDPT